MKAVIQRIASRASVTGIFSMWFSTYNLVDSQVVSSIERGLCVLIGVGAGLLPLYNSKFPDDTVKDAETLAKKILSLRLFNDESNQQMWKRSVRDIDGEVLCGNTIL